MTRPKQSPAATKEQWFAVCDKATGEAVSFGTVLGELPASLEAVAIASQPSKRAGTRWDPATKAVVDIPATAPRDVVGELLADPVVAAITARLSKAESAALEEKLRAKLV